MVLVRTRRTEKVQTHFGKLVSFGTLSLLHVLPHLDFLPPLLLLLLSVRSKHTSISAAHPGHTLALLGRRPDLFLFLFEEKRLGIQLLLHLPASCFHGLLVSRHQMSIYSQYSQHFNQVQYKDLLRSSGLCLEITKPFMSPVIILRHFNSNKWPSASFLNKVKLGYSASFTLKCFGGGTDLAVMVDSGCCPAHWISSGWSPGWSGTPRRSHTAAPSRTGTETPRLRGAGGTTGVSRETQTNTDSRELTLCYSLKTTNKARRRKKVSRLFSFSKLSLYFKFPNLWKLKYSTRLVCKSLQMFF